MTVVVTGTDTGVGKTVVAAMLTLALDGVYWKPVQAGISEATDTVTVAAMSGLGPEHFISERYRLAQPLSPHRAAELDGVEIDVHSLLLPGSTPNGRPLIVEGAGGLMVPLTRRTLYIDVLQRWGAPIILCARTSLGTINHSLLSLEALRNRDIPVLGVVFVGEAVPDTEQTICALTHSKRLGRLPLLPRLTPETLAEAFRSGFRRDDLLP